MMNRRTNDDYSRRTNEDWRTHILIEDHRAAAVRRHIRLSDHHIQDAFSDLARTGRWRLRYVVAAKMHGISLAQ